MYFSLKGPRFRWQLVLLSARVHLRPHVIRAVVLLRNCGTGFRSDDAKERRRRSRMLYVTVERGRANIVIYREQPVIGVVTSPADTSASTQLDSF